MEHKRKLIEALINEIYGDIEHGELFYENRMMQQTIEITEKLLNTMKEYKYTEE